MTFDVKIPDLNEAEQANVNAMWAQLTAVAKRNRIRDDYYDAEQKLKKITSAIPPQFQSLVTVLGWPAKAVDTLANRCVLEGFVSTIDGLVDDLGIDQLMLDNRIDSEGSQAQSSSLIHAVSFLTVTKGEQGEPAALIAARDARSGTGIWNTRRRDLDCFLSIVDADDDGQPVDLVYYDRGSIVTAKRAQNKWSIERATNVIGRVPVEPLVYRPRLGRPFGSSRISRPVMAYTNLAMRTVLRSEVTAELYSVPQRVFLGAEDRDFQDEAGNPLPQWQYVMSKIINVQPNEEGQNPSMTETKQASQQPHMDQLRNLAQLFAGETSIPTSSLGITTDANPTSADAYYASREDLISLAESTTRDWTPAWQRAILTAAQIAHDEPEIPAEWWTVRPQWRPAQYASRAAATDAVTKLLPAFPWMADSDVALELLGFDQVTTRRLIADRRRLGAGALIDRIMATPAAQEATADAVPAA